MLDTVEPNIVALNPKNHKERKEMSRGEAMWRGWVEIKRDLTEIDHAGRQLKLYAPCTCGSGKKFKWCCYENKD